MNHISDSPLIYPYEANEVNEPFPTSFSAIRCTQVCRAFVRRQFGLQTGTCATPRAPMETNDPRAPPSASVPLFVFLPLACHRLAETERGRIAKLLESSIIPTCAPTPPNKANRLPRNEPCCTSLMNPKNTSTIENRSIPL